MQEKKELNLPRFTDSLSNQTRLFSYLIISILSSCAAVYSESVQRDLEKYWQIHTIVGESAANFVLGQLGDVAVPLAAGSLVATLFHVLSRFELFADMEEFDDITATLLLFVTFAIYGSLELVYMFPIVDTSNCGDSFDFCKGEISDFIAFGLPFIIAITALKINSCRKKISKK